MKTSLYCAIFGMFAVGCHGNSGGVDKIEATNSSWQPSQYSLEDARLVFYGTSVPVKIKINHSNSELSLKVLSHGEEVESEQEVYPFNDQEFDIRQAGEDTFSPNLPLLKFPLTTGQTWDWKGTITSGSVGRAATAKIVTSADKLMVQSNWTPAVKVVVNLAIDSGTAKPAERALTYWFPAGMGPIKRVYGAGSTRAPAEQ